MRRRTVLLTGASAGLGSALACELAGRGHRLALVARRADRLDDVAAEVERRGGEAIALPADLADPEATAEVVEAAVGHFGGLDVLINNAGFGLPDYFARSEPDDLRRQVAVNLVAPMLLARAALPHLVASRGVVINVGSGISHVANPIFGAYGATKAGLAYWNDAFRREVGHRGIAVCLVEPGPIDTEFFDAVDRLAPGEVALGTGPPPDSLYNALRDRPPRLLGATAEEAARRIAGLIDRPRRRLSVLRRAVWPVQVIGACFRLAPILGDLAISGMVRRVDRERAGRRVAEPVEW